MSRTTSTLAFMTDTITLTGLVATTPRHLVTGEGLPITSFRLASTQRRFDRSQERWIDGDTNWYTITAFRQLAINVAGSIVKGDRIVTTGRLRIRDWAAGERAGTNIEVDADAIGHDLSWGTSSFTRSIATAPVESAAAGMTADSVPEQFPSATANELETEDGALAEIDSDASVPVPF